MPDDFIRASIKAWAFLLLFIMGSRVRTTENYHENRTHEIHFGSKH